MIDFLGYSRALLLDRPENQMNGHRNHLDTDPSGSGNALSLWVAERLVSLMAEHGVPVRQQASLLSELCNLSPSQARRKLRGTMWSFGEVLTVVRRFGVSLDQVFSDSLGESNMQSDSLVGTSTATLQEATFVTDALVLPCLVRLGALVVGSSAESDLLTAQDDSGWYVGPKGQLDRRHITASRYRASQVLLMPKSSTPRIRIAILDDDIGTTETLGDWFEAIGYEAQTFTASDQLLASKIENHDAFVVDFMLGGGDSSKAVIRSIREALPEAPIILLTGKLRSGLVSEADLTTLLRTLNVTFFEKPVRPAVLAATIEKELDALSHRRQK